MRNQPKRDQGRGGLQSLSDKNQIMTLVYAPKRTMSNRVLEVLGIFLVLVAPYLVLVIGG